MKRAKLRLQRLEHRVRRQGARMAQFIRTIRRGEAPEVSSLADDSCAHDWQRDGQTMTAIRWTCTRCGASYLG